MTECPFCGLLATRNRIIFRNDLVFAFPTNIPIVPGHVLLCPVRHVVKLEELTPEELAAFLELRIKIRDALRGAFGAQGFHYAWNEEKIAGQSVPHFHFHVVPRNEGDAGITEYEPRKFLYRPGSRETSSEKELAAVAKEIAAKLAK